MLVSPESMTAGKSLKLSGEESAAGTRFCCKLHGIVSWRACGIRTGEAEWWQSAARKTLRPGISGIIGMNNAAS